MGNCCTTASRIKDYPINSISFTIKDKSSSEYKSQTYGKGADRIATFRMSVQDLVQKKSGNIYHDYKILDSLGKGAYGEVKKAKHRISDAYRAIKKISSEELTEESRNKLINEDHPNIIQVYEYYEDAKFFYIVIDLCTGGELFDRIMIEQRLSEFEAGIIMRQIFSAISYCHARKIVHRDLKPENIMYKTDQIDSEIKIIDFGTGRVFNSSEKMHNRYGTTYYIAPEVIDKNYDEKCDVWSCGVILYIVLCGKPPFTGSNDKNVFENIKLGQFEFKGYEWEEVSKDAKKLICSMLVMEPTKRISMDEALCSHWVSKYSLVPEVESNVMTAVLTNLKNFRVRNKLKRAIWVYLVNAMATNKEKETLLHTFQALDTDNNGQLDKKELLEAYHNVMSIDEPELNIDSIINAVDFNGNNTIEYSEFLVATMSKKLLFSKKRLEKAFKLFDKNDSGFITINDLKEVFSEINCNDENWSKLVKSLSDDPEGKISFESFIKMFNPKMDTLLKLKPST